MKKKLHKIAREENVLSLSGNLLVALFGIMGFAFLARTFSVKMFGQWVLFMAAVSFIDMFRFGIANIGFIRYLSGADDSSRINLKGSNAVIGLYATIITSVVIFICNQAFHLSMHNSGYSLFFTWYPLLAFVNLPWNNALVILQAERAYGRILLLKSINSILFFLVVLLNYYFFNLTLVQIVVSYLIINGLSSLISLGAGWDGLKYLKKASKETCKTLLHFGKYTVFTLIGTNLLRSADTFIISLSPLGNAAVALYSIPLKLTELQQIPLRSFAATAFPKMSKASMQGRVGDVRQLFYTYAGALTYLFIFLSGFTFLFADKFVLLLAGKQYLQADPVMGFNAVSIVRVFSLYGLLLPVDRMTGIGLDSVNKPGVNALKVLFMVIANIIGDLVAVFVFKSLLLAAVASVLFTLLGTWIGMYFLGRELSLQSAEIFRQGLVFYKTILHKLTGRPSGGFVKAQ